jgi:hypothetical protein
MAPPPNSGIVLVLDTDEAGQKATESSGLYLLDLFGDWGEPRYPSEPTSHAVAQVQQAIDDLGDEIKALEALGIDDDTLAQTINIRILAWEHMDNLLSNERRSIYSNADNADEFAVAQTIADTPIEIEHGRIDYAAIKQNIDIVEYIERDTGPLRRSGKTLRTNCPLVGHKDSSPSFYVYPHNSSFYCFGCRAGGDIIEYARLRGVRASEIA